MTKTDYQSSEFVQGKLHKFCQKVGEGLSKPKQKFIKDMTFGLCLTGSPSIHNISKYVPDKVDTKTTSERLYRNLKENDFVELIEEKMLDFSKPYINEQTIFIVDETDIEKPYAKKMEGLQRVHNGSKGEQTNGYIVLNIVAFTKHNGINLMLPVYSRIIASTMENERTAKQYMMEAVEKISETNNGKGVFVFDRGFDDRNIIGDLVSRKIDFVIRGVGKRAIKEGFKEVNFKDFVNKMNFKYEVPSTWKNTTFRCATGRIRVRTEDHPSKHASSVEISLVVSHPVRNNTKCGSDFYLLCNLSEGKLSDLETITSAMNIYRKRWSIEEVHRQMKQCMDWESMKLGSYQGLKNLNALMALVLFFIYSSKKDMDILCTNYSKILTYTKKERNKKKDFVYYRITEVLSLALYITTYYRKPPTKAERIDRHQMKIRL
ncbi:MAG: transposase [Candidatus Cloacimonetes bacterium]|nr:transposase [Candidatus Cloacimonadota bacterium]